jgi:tetratricopeptide (TPR) repeat protein
MNVMSRLAVAFVVVAWMVAGPARAQPAPDPAESGTQAASTQQQKADALFEQGRKLMETDAAGACDNFNQAIQLDPTAAGTMLNLGLCNQKLGKYKTALYWFRKAQARATESNLPAHEKAAREHTTELATKVATIKIAFTGVPPPNTRVKIDGEEVKADDYGHAEVDPGHHALDAAAPGRKLFHLEFDVTGTGGQTETVTLVEGENVIDRGRGRRRTALYLAIGGGVLWIASGSYSLWQKSVYDDNVTMGMPRANIPNAAQNANAAQHNARLYGTGLFVAGSVAITIGAILYFTAPQRERIDQTVFIPTLGPDQVGFAATGSF